MNTRRTEGTHLDQKNADGEGKDEGKNTEINQNNKEEEQMKIDQCARGRIIPKNQITIQKENTKKKHKRIQEEEKALTQIRKKPDGEGKERSLPNEREKGEMKGNGL